jgi:hypothetical protein
MVHCERARFATLDRKPPCRREREDTRRRCVLETGSRNQQETKSNPSDRHGWVSMCRVSGDAVAGIRSDVLDRVEQVTPGQSRLAQPALPAGHTPDPRFSLVYCPNLLSP